LGPIVINQWFKKSNGLALGILSATGGLFGAIAQPITAELIGSLGWRTAYITVGIAVIVIIVPVALLLMKRSPQAQEWNHMEKPMLMESQRVLQPIQTKMKESN